MEFKLETILNVLWLEIAVHLIYMFWHFSLFSTEIANRRRLIKIEFLNLNRHGFKPTKKFQLHEFRMKNLEKKARWMHFFFRVHFHTLQIQLFSYVIKNKSNVQKRKTWLPFNFHPQHIFCWLRNSFSDESLLMSSNSAGE